MGVRAGYKPTECLRGPFRLASGQQARPLQPKGLPDAARALAAAKVARQNQRAHFVLEMPARAVVKQRRVPNLAGHWAVGQISTRFEEFRTNRSGWLSKPGEIGHAWMSSVARFRTPLRVHGSRPTQGALIDVSRV